MEKLIKEFKEGDRIQLDLLVNNVTKGVSNAGAPYLSITLQDNTGTIEGKKWDASDLDTIIAEAGKVVKIYADVISYRDNLQLKIFQIDEVDQSQIDIFKFALPSPVPQADLIKKLNSYLASLQDEDIKKIVNTIINKYYDRFITYPAASKNHHAFASGLLYHTLCMVDVASFIGRYYEDVNNDLLIAGCI
jgi:3'-5' exoribonuclease